MKSYSIMNNTLAAVLLIGFGALSLLGAWSMLAAMDHQAECWASLLYGQTCGPLNVTLTSLSFHAGALKTLTAALAGLAALAALARRRPLGPRPLVLTGKPTQFKPYVGAQNLWDLCARLGQLSLAPFLRWKNFHGKHPNLKTAPKLLF